jgi:hypothetical protein
MKATDFDAQLACPVCGGDGDDPVQYAVDGTAVCRRCDGAGEINRYGPNDPHPDHDDEVILRETINEDTNALIVEKMPRTSENSGGFDGRYGDWTPQDTSTEAMAEYEPDLLDRLRNDALGTSTNSNDEYVLPDDEFPDDELYSGTNLSKNDLPHGWIGDGSCSACNGQDICPTCTIGWVRARGDEYTASVLESVVDELDLYR